VLIIYVSGHLTNEDDDDDGVHCWPQF